jgi:hypothetical protein
VGDLPPDQGFGWIGNGLDRRPLEEGADLVF